MQNVPLKQRISDLTWQNRLVEELPGDPNLENRPRQVDNACYTEVKPTPVKAPNLVAFSAAAATTIGLAPEASLAPDFVELLSGNTLLQNMRPYAMCYGGHQFGHWAGQLGDGRVINLGEVVAPAGESWVLQLKGAGLTPYSRSADGRAVLRSSVREFLCSEAMHHLGIPTTRALSLVTTGEQVVRDMFYDGDSKAEPGAIVCRLARSFLRLGNYQIFAARKDTATLEALVRFTLRRHFPQLGEYSKATVLDWLQQVCESTARLMIDWLRVGFVHGVMNTDNLSILGETIDYGPYGWLESYDPDWTPNTTDAAGRRYCYANQPQIALWNLLQFANALYPLIGEAKPLEERLDCYANVFTLESQTMIADKLGFARFRNDDQALVDELLNILVLVETDMTLFFRGLADMDIKAAVHESNFDVLTAPIADAWYQPESLSKTYRDRVSAWLQTWAGRVVADGRSMTAVQAAMRRVNPKYVLRNYLVQQAIELAEQGDYARIHELLDVMRRPYDEQPGRESFAAKRPEWARHKAGCSMLSCSS